MENTALKNHLKRLEKKLFIIYGIGLLVLLLLAVLSNYLLKEQAARQATSLIKRTVQRDFRETVYTLNDAKLDYFGAVVYYNADGRRLFSLPADLDPEFANKTNFLSNLRYARLTINLYFDEHQEHKIGSVLFVFGRYSHVPYAVFIWLFFLIGTIPLVRASRIKVTEHVHLSEEATRADLARRVRHDIRSPLGALQIATQSLNGVSTKQRAIIQRATERISEIVSELELIRLSKAEGAAQSGMTPKIASHSMLTIAQDIIQEKRAQLAALRPEIQFVPEFSRDAFFLFANVNAPEIKRTLSNIIDNAVEACARGGRITVRVAKDGGELVLEVSDDGAGIATADLACVTEKGFTKKRNGSGLGLYYAEKAVKDAGGDFQIRSNIGRGTTVTIRLPSSPPPKWYIPKVQVPHRATVVILDDQESTHLSWRMRLDELKTKGAEFSVAAFKSPGELLAWHEQAAVGPRLYLLDYDLGNGAISGLDIAHKLGLSENTILVTGHYDSEEIQRRCTDLGVSLLPKSYLPLVSLESL